MGAQAGSARATALALRLLLLQCPSLATTAPIGTTTAATAISTAAAATAATGTTTAAVMVVPVVCFRHFVLLCVVLRSCMLPYMGMVWKRTA